MPASKRLLGWNSTAMRPKTANRRMTQHPQLLAPWHDQTHITTTLFQPRSISTRHPEESNATALQWVAMGKNMGGEEWEERVCVESHQNDVVLVFFF